MTGDASLDWISRAAPAIVTTEITGLVKVMPLAVESMSDAYRLQATRFLHGYFSKRGHELHFEIQVEDASRHKMVQTIAIDGAVLSAMNLAARQIDPAAREFSTANADAVTAWGRGEYERAVEIDPDFGSAWTAWVQVLAAKGDPSRAGEAAQRALQRPTLRSPVDRARLEIISATLRKDTDARRSALIALAQLLPGDVSAPASLAEMELAARHFQAAAEQYRKVLRLDPRNGQVMNLLGYVEAYSGNLDAARKSIEEYGKEPTQKTNSLDSLGEISFMNGRFTDAEKYFLQAYESNPDFLAGVDLMKAAYARALAGDLKGGDSYMQRYLQGREKARDASVLWREAAWLYATGRREQAIAKLQSAPADQLTERQMAVWQGNIAPPSDLTALKDLYERTPISADGQIRTFYAAALLAAGKKEEAQKLLVLWPLPGTGDPLLESMVFPKFQELRHAAGL